MTSTGSRTSDNDVFLRGRLAAEPESRILPSGDELCVFRVTVARPSGERVKVDSIDCATTSARVRRTVSSVPAGELLAVTGSLHRRFWRSAAGLGSRYEVSVSSASRVRRRGNGA